MLPLRTKRLLEESAEEVYIIGDVDDWEQNEEAESRNVVYDHEP
jgi:hypothetical protein